MFVPVNEGCGPLVSEDTLQSSARQHRAVVTVFL